MNQLSSLNPARREGYWAIALGAALYAASLGLAGAADDSSAPAPKPGDPKIAQAMPAEKKKEPAKPKKEQKKLTGAELYAINCNRCHPERYPTEWTPAQWKSLMIHMRVRANLPAEQARIVAKYLQEEAGN